MSKTRPELSLKELRKAVDLDGALDLSMKELKDKDLPVKEMVSLYVDLSHQSELRFSDLVTHSTFYRLHSRVKSCRCATLISL